MASNRNKPCTCGSGLKYKKCCLFKKEDPVPEPVKEAGNPDPSCLLALTAFIPWSIPFLCGETSAAEVVGTLEGLGPY